MKSFLSKNWKNIIFVICGIAIAINLIIVIATPPTVTEQFYKYGPTVKSDVVDKTIGTADNAEGKAEDGVDTLTDFVSENTGYSDSNARIIVIIALLICGVLILSNIIDSDSSAKKK